VPALDRIVAVGPWQSSNLDHLRLAGGVLEGLVTAGASATRGASTARAPSAAEDQRGRAGCRTHHR
jgi:hypothetical protein